MKIKKTLLFSIIIFSLISSLFSVSVLGIADINYTFEKDILYTSTNPEPDNFFNVRNITEYTEIYNATYSFTNEIVGTTGIDIDFIDVDNNDANTNTKIIDEKDGHNKILEAYDNNNSGRFEFSNLFIPQVSGSIEFWFQMTNISLKTTYIRLRESSTFSVAVSIFNSDGKLYYYNGSSQVIQDILVDTWYHVRIDFNCITDTNDIYINGIKIIESGAFWINVDSITEFYVLSDNTHLDYYTYFDAIGYSFEVIENFDFENDIIGNEPLLWNINPHGGSSIATVERFQESNVLKVLDNDIVNNIHVVSDLTQSIDQSIEYYIAVNDISLTDWYYMRFVESGSGRVLLRIDNNDLDYHNGAVWSSVKDDFIIINTWFKITINLHDSVNTFDIFIDDILEGSNLGFITNSIVSVNQLSFESGATETSITYLDNFNINSTNFIHYNYSIGQNIIPFIYVDTTNKEINHYDFALREPDLTYPIGYGSHGLFIQNWEILGNEATISVDNSEVFGSIPYLRDRAIRFEQTGASGGGAIQKTNMELIDNFIDITLGFSVSVYDINGGYIKFAIYSEAPILVDLRIYKTGGNINLAYYDGSYNDLYSGLNLNDIYFIDLLVNLEIDRGFIQLYENDTIIIDDNFPLVNNNESKVDNIDFGTNGNVGNHIIVDVDDIGIYKSGRNYIEFNSTFMYFNFIFGKTWIFKQQSLFSMIANGTLSIYGRGSSGDIDYFPSLVPFPGATMYFLNDFTSHDNSLFFYNLYDFNQTPHFQFARLIIYSRDNFSINYLNIEGSKLTEGLNEYILEFDYSNVNINNSYFYTDTSNRLQFTHFTDNTNTSEFIQARFNINDTTSTEARISFRSLINNNAKGFFRINYTTTSDFIPFPIVQSTTSTFLTQGKNIRDLIIIISDLDDNSVSGLTSGFIDNVKILFLENIQITVITLSLIGMIIPLIIILTPTVALRDLYGKSFVIPIFLLMSLILVISGIIPIWLFFIIALSSSLFLVKENVQRDD